MKNIQFLILVLFANIITAGWIKRTISTDSDRREQLSDQSGSSQQDSSSIVQSQPRVIDFYEMEYAYLKGGKLSELDLMYQQLSALQKQAKFMNYFDLYFGIIPAGHYGPLLYLEDFTEFSQFFIQRYKNQHFLVYPYLRAKLQGSIRVRKWILEQYPRMDQFASDFKSTIQISGVDNLNLKLISAVRESDWAKVYACLMNGADVHYDQDKSLLVALNMKNIKVIELLYQYGAQVNNFEHYNKAIKNNDLQLSDTILQFGYYDYDKALKHATVKGDVQKMRLAVSGGADVHQDKDFLIVRAAAEKQLDALLYLLKQGVDQIERVGMCVQIFINQNNFDGMRLIFDYLIFQFKRLPNIPGRAVVLRGLEVLLNEANEAIKASKSSPTQSKLQMQLYIKSIAEQVKSINYFQRTSEFE